MTRTSPTSSLKRPGEFLREEYLPKIERCVEKLTNEQIWWRPNPRIEQYWQPDAAPFGQRPTVDCLRAGRNEADERQRQTEFDERGVIPREELLGILRTTIADVDRVLADFDSARLLDDIQSRALSRLRSRQSFT